MRAWSLVGVGLVVLVPAVAGAQGRDLVRLPSANREPLATPVTAELHRLHHRLALDTLLTVPAGATPHCRSDAVTNRGLRSGLFDGTRTAPSSRAWGALVPPCGPAPKPRPAR